MRAGRVWAAACVIALVACAGPPRPAEAPEQDPNTVEEALLRIDTASRVIQASATLAQTAKTEESAAAPAAPPSPKGLGPERRWGADTAAPPHDSSRSSPCDTSCRAIDSMRRAVAALCRMAGEADARCEDAKHTLSESEQRVAACGCVNR